MVQAEFVAQPAELKGGVQNSDGKRLLGVGKIAARVLPSLRGEQLFSYLFRRFGYPNEDWDDDKDLVCYLLTTPMNGLFLRVRPLMGGDMRGESDEAADQTWLMFGYCIELEIEDRILSAPGYQRAGLPLFKRCALALEGALADLQRPVPLRSVSINCYGRLLDGELTRLPAEAGPYPGAGFAVPPEFFRDPGRYGRFFDALLALGGGEVERGMERVIGVAQAEQGRLASESQPPAEGRPT